MDEVMQIAGNNANVNIGQDTMLLSQDLTDQTQKSSNFVTSLTKLKKGFIVVNDLTLDRKIENSYVANLLDTTQENFILRTI